MYDLDEGRINLWISFAQNHPKDLKHYRTKMARTTLSIILSKKKKNTLNHCIKDFI